MTDRVLLVTGASRGIGAATVRRAAERGFAVCVNYRDRKESAETVVDDIRRAGGIAIAVQADTTDEAQVRTMFDAIEAGLGPVTHLVNNAGLIGGSSRLADLDLGVLRQLIEVNVVGYFICAREAVRRMSTELGGMGGVIINVSSVSAAHGSAGERVHYAASKGAVNSFTIGLAKEVAGEGIRVNAFSPGVTDTEMNSPDRLERVAAVVPAGRVGRPEEMADGILWLLSDEASYMYGANLVMSGGR